MDENGWPGKSLVGEEGAYAAITIAQHAISQPELQKQFLVELKKAVTQGEATPIQAACLEDRILYNQGKPGRYGMLFGWDDSGNLVASEDKNIQTNAGAKTI